MTLVEINKDNKGKTMTTLNILKALDVNAEKGCEKAIKILRKNCLFKIEDDGLFFIAEVDGKFAVFTYTAYTDLSFFDSIEEVLKANKWLEENEEWQEFLAVVR